MFIQFYCFVSLGSAQSSLNNVERYDPRTNTWAPVAPMLKKRSLLNVAVLDGNNLFFHRGTLLCMLKVTKFIIPPFRKTCIGKISEQLNVAQRLW